jgi:ABC-type transporter Mla MlaB component
MESGGRTLEKRRLARAFHILKARRTTVVKVNVRADGADTIIELVGDPGESLPALARESILRRAGAGQRFLLDLTRLGPLSRAGLSTLLVLIRRIKALGGTILARNVPEAVITLTDAAGFVVLSRESVLSKGQPFHDVVFPCIDIHPSHYHTGLGLRQGLPLPFGASLVERGINFSIYSRHAVSCTLVLFQSGKPDPLAEIPFPAAFRIGDVFAMTVIGLDPDTIEYGFRVDGPFAPKQGHRFDPTKILLDPAARAVSGRAEWGRPSSAPLLGCLVPDDFDWEGDRPLRLPTEDRRRTWSSTKCTFAASLGAPPRGCISPAPTPVCARRSPTCASWESTASS